MTDHVPLTDEELAEIEARYWDAALARGVDATRLLGAWVRAGNHNLRLIADLRASRAEVERLREALDFYADPENWEAVPIQVATPGGPNEWASEWESGEAMDGGDRARRALNVPLP